MSMYNDIVWAERGNIENCLANSVNIIENTRKFPQGRWSFLEVQEDMVWNPYSQTGQRMGEDR